MEDFYLLLEDGFRITFEPGDGAYLLEGIVGEIWVEQAAATGLWVEQTEATGIWIEQ